MPILRTEHGLLDTAKLPRRYEPTFCAMCEYRIGWENTEFSTEGIVICDECAAKVARGEERAP